MLPAFGLKGFEGSAMSRAAAALHENLVFLTSTVHVHKGTFIFPAN